MPTTGTNVFTVTRDDIIKAALRVLGVIGTGETPNTEDYTNCSQALNIMIKGWSTVDQPLWVVQSLQIPMITGVLSYQIGPTATGTGAIVMSRPLGMFSAFIRDSNNLDTVLTPISRQEYDEQGSKTSAGTPNQFYFDRQEPNATLYVFNVPSDSTHTIYARIQRQFYDMTSSTDNFDFPEEFFQALKWGLAADLCVEYGVDAKMIPYYEQKAEHHIDLAFASSQEDTNVYFTIDPQVGITRG
jgi:hypothetical protein